MITKYLIIVLLIVTLPSVICAQSLELLGQKVNFGKGLNEQGNNFWNADNQIESEYPYIKVFEGDNTYGGFYKNKLVYFVHIVNDNNPYPVCEEIENILSNLKPYKKDTEFEGIGCLIEMYKWNEFYISRTSSRMNTDYTFIPVKSLEEIRLTHPNFLVNQF